MEWYLEVLKNNYSNFSGRARRKEYWMFALFHFIVIILLTLFMIGMLAAADASDMTALAIVGVIPFALYILGTIIPSLAVAVRRLHDIGKSGWWVLTPQIPFVGSIFAIVLLVFYCQDGDPDDNEWGPSPKEDENLTAVFE